VAACTILEQDKLEDFGGFTPFFLAWFATPEIARDKRRFPAMPGEEWDEVLQEPTLMFYNVLHPVIMPMDSPPKNQAHRHHVIRFRCPWGIVDK